MKPSRNHPIRQEHIDAPVHRMELNVERQILAMDSIHRGIIPGNHGKTSI
jgi:hypothetical protein